MGIYHSINKQFTNVNGKVQKMADLLGVYIHTTLLINVSFDKLSTVCFDSFCGSRCSGFDLLMMKKHIYNYCEFWMRQVWASQFMVLRSQWRFEWMWYFEIVFIHVPDIRLSTGTIPLALGVATTPSTSMNDNGKYRKLLICWVSEYVLK